MQVLDRLATLSGRPRAQVLRRLILTAENQPQAIQALGNLNKKRLETEV